MILLLGDYMPGIHKLAEPIAVEDWSRPLGALSAPQARAAWGVAVDVEVKHAAVERVLQRGLAVGKDLRNAAGMDAETRKNLFGAPAAPASPGE